MLFICSVVIDFAWRETIEGLGTLDGRGDGPCPQLPTDCPSLIPVALTD